MPLSLPSRAVARPRTTFHLRYCGNTSSKRLCGAQQAEARCFPFFLLRPHPSGVVRFGEINYRSTQSVVLDVNFFFVFLACRCGHRSFASDAYEVNTCFLPVLYPAALTPWLAVALSRFSIQEHACPHPMSRALLPSTLSPEFVVDTPCDSHLGRYFCVFDFGLPSHRVT